MSEKETVWGEGGFDERFLNFRDVIVPCMGNLEAVFYDFFKNLIKEDSPLVCELGCGDGATMEGLLRMNPAIRGVLVDGSSFMLEQAKRRLSAFGTMEYVESDFSELTNNGLGRRGFHLVYSSLALHHLEKEDKRHLLKHVERALLSGGYFVNMDIVVPPSKDIEEWYERVYRVEMDEAARKRGIESVADEVIKRASAPEHRKRLLTLEEELELLKETGFIEVECYYKYMGFCVYGGRKSLAISTG